MASMDNRLPQVTERLQQAEAAGLRAAAYVLQAEIKRRLAGGYTSGAWVTGRLLNSVEIAGPVLEAGALTIRVGSRLPYALYWELGHRNIFTRRFERQERWMPAFLESWDRQQQAYAQAFRGIVADGQTAPRLANDIEFEAGPSTGPSAAFPPGAPSRPYGRQP